MMSLWGQVASGYMNIILQIMQQGKKESEAFWEQMDEMREQALRFWQPSSPSSRDQIREAIDELQKQIESLSERIECLEEQFQSETERMK